METIMAEKVAKVELNAEELYSLMDLISSANQNTFNDIGHLYYEFAQHWDILTNFGDDYEL